MTPEQMMTVEAMARAWGQWQAEPGFPFDDSHCINGARVVTRALEKLDIPSRAVSVQFLLFNRPAWMLYEQDVPLSEWPDEAWSLGIGPAAQAGVTGRWDGHLVVEGDGWALDISAMQFNRPGRIVIDGPRLMPPLPTSGHFMQLEDARGQVLLIKPWPENNGWRSAGGWLRLHGTEVKEIVRRTQHLMRERNLDGNEDRDDRTADSSAGDGERGAEGGGERPPA